MVIVALAVGLIVIVGESVNVRITTGVADGRVEGGRVCVAVGGTGGVRKKVDIRARRIRIPMLMGMAYLRSRLGKVAFGATGISPEYPKALNKLFRLAA